MIEVSDARELTHSYHQQRQCAEQWRDFLRLFIAELFSSAGESDACAFLRHIGARMASEMPLAECDTLEEFEADLNILWHRMDWGWVRFLPRERGIAIVHGACPLPVRWQREQADHSEHTRASRALGAVLEGAYATWLAEQGGVSTVPLQAVSTAPDGPLEFIYGKAGT